MTEHEVPRVATPVAVADLIEALRSGWRALLRTEPREESLLLLAAHWAFETGWGKVGGWNWNLGNRKHVDGDGRHFFWMACGEMIDGEEVTLEPPDPGCRFCSFPTLEAGAADYLAMLHGQYGKAWPAVEAGDVAAFAHGLKTLRYYTDDEAHYTATMVSVVGQIRRSYAPPAIAPNPDGARLLELDASVAAGREGLP